MPGVCFLSYSIVEGKAMSVAICNTNLVLQAQNARHACTVHEAGGLLMRVGCPPLPGVPSHLPALLIWDTLCCGICHYCRTYGPEAALELLPNELLPDGRVPSHFKLRMLGTPVGHVMNMSLPAGTRLEDLPEDERHAPVMKM